MTNEEVTAAVLSDPDAQPLMEEQLRKLRRLPEVRAELFSAVGWL